MPAPFPRPDLLRRRHVAAALVALPVFWTGARAQSPAVLRPTPAQTEGPFYPVSLPADSDNDLLRNGTLNYSRGDPAWVEGQVLDLSGRPVSGAEVEIWQCDEAGHYHHPGDGGRADPAFQGFGRTRVAADGAWRFRTIRPVPYTGRTPHIHVKVRLGTRELLTTQLYVQGDPHNVRDGLWRRLAPADREALTVPFSAAAQGLRARFPIVVAA
jgi:protocatechuate 3,4-dioxygenase beta subunit